MLQKKPWVFPKNTVIIVTFAPMQDDMHAIAHPLFVYMGLVCLDQRSAMQGLRQVHLGQADVV